MKINLISTRTHKNIILVFCISVRIREDTEATAIIFINIMNLENKNKGGTKMMEETISPIIKLMEVKKSMNMKQRSNLIAVRRVASFAVQSVLATVPLVLSVCFPAVPAAWRAVALVLKH